MPAPTVTSISPSIGGTVGGATVTLTGTNFTGTTGVTIGGAACTSVSVVNPTTITCVTPAGTRGEASVVVTNGSGSNGANSLFIYLTTVPTDTYIYLKGGRGDGFVPRWTGEFRDAEVSVKSDAYRDIFRRGLLTVGKKGADATYQEGTTQVVTSLRLSNPSLVAGFPSTLRPGVLEGTLTATDSDDESHTPPRQFDKTVSCRFYMTADGIEYHYELAQITGVGTRKRGY